MNQRDAARGIGAREPDAVAFAHGRVNLMGDHTDYNGGFVLPVCIPQRTRVRLWRRNDAEVRALSAEVSDGIEAFALGELASTGRWVDYVQGVVFALLREGYSLRGFEVSVDSTVPVGSGLSSSAALEVSLLRALREAFGLALTDQELARLARAAETDFVGAPVGIMDQMAASLGDERGALYLDTRSLAFEVVPLPRAVELVVIDSGIAHSHATGEYSVRRAECTRAARLLGVELLSELSLPADSARIATLAGPLERRVRHVVTENARVHHTVAAFRRDDPEEAGRLFHASHESLRDDYGVSTPELDALVQAAADDRDVFGARMTGGGFGGCIVALARAGAGRVVATRLIAATRDTLPSPAVVLPPAAS